MHPRKHSRPNEILKFEPGFLRTPSRPKEIEKPTHNFLRTPSTCKRYRKQKERCWAQPRISERNAAKTKKHEEIIKSKPGFPRTPRKSQNEIPRNHKTYLTKIMLTRMMSGNFPTHCIIVFDWFDIACCQGAHTFAALPIFRKILNVQFPIRQLWNLISNIEKWNKYNENKSRMW